jgi:hypothetical protein
VRIDRGVIYVNKAHVVSVTPVAGPSSCRGGGGSRDLSMGSQL